MTLQLRDTGAVPSIGTGVCQRAGRERHAESAPTALKSIGEEQPSILIQSEKKRIGGALFKFHGFSYSLAGSRCTDSPSRSITPSIFASAFSRSSNTVGLY